MKALSGKATSAEVDFSDVTVAEDWLHQILQKNEENITAITLQDYAFPKDQYEIFKTDLTKNTTLKQLKIVFPVIQTTPTTNLFEGIANNTSIERLTITLPKTSFSVWQDLGQLFTRNKFIKSLHIVEAPLVNQTSPFEDVAADLFKSLANNQVLKRLLLFEYNFSARDILALQEGLKHNKSIQFLYISGKIGTAREHEIGPLGEALKCNSTITQLFLLAMKVPNEHFKQLFDGLKVNKSIKQLTWNIVVDSLDPFLQYLQTTHSLTTLELKQHNLTKDVERSLFSALAANKSISSLKLLIDLQTDAISVLKDKTTITKLIFRGKMNEEATKAFETSLKFNKTLTSLDASESATNYSEVLKHNTTLKELKVPSLKHQELIEVIQYGQFLKALVVDNLTGDFKGQGEFDTILKQTMESNYTLTSYWVANTDNNRFNYICNRNYALQKQRYEDTAMIIHIIARSSLFDQLPTELWTAIFSEITYPGLDSFKSLAISIFKMYPRS